MAEDSSKKRPPSDDDRNLVVVDEDFANADAEDRLWLFWERNKNLIVNPSPPSPSSKSPTTSARPTN